MRFSEKNSFRRESAADRRRIRANRSSDCRLRGNQFGRSRVVARLMTSAVLALMLTTPALSQDWGKKLFVGELTHDFGAVARGAKTIHRFEMTNPFVEDIHIASVRASCGCTIATIEEPTIKTFEKSAILADFQTSKFQGKRGATITVVIDKPYYAEVQLRVDGYIRSDVVFYPGQVDFGEVAVGASTQTEVKVSYAGRNDWRIRDVRSANPNFEVELKETVRFNSRVDYTMLVRLKPDAAPGYIQDQLTLVTDDQQREALVLPVTGRVQAALEMRPSPLVLGVIRSGQKVTKNLVIQGHKPFRILDIKCDDPSIQFTKPTKEAALQVLVVSYTAGKTLGELNRKVRVLTDLDGGTAAECSITGEIKGDVKPGVAKSSG